MGLAASTPLLRLFGVVGLTPNERIMSVGTIGHPFIGTDGPAAGGVPSVGTQLPRSRTSTFRASSNTQPTGPNAPLVWASRRGEERGASFWKAGPTVPAMRPSVKFA